MTTVRMTASSVVFAAMMICHVGCRQDANPNSKKAASPAGKAFLDKKMNVPAGLEWNTNVVSKNGGQFSFQVVSQGPFAVTIITDAGYQALKNDDQNNFKKSDVLMTIDSKENTYESNVTVPQGTSWFIIENQAKKEVEFHLQCFAP